MKAMILAAGRGERMMPLTSDTPKPLLKVGQYCLIEHTVLKLKKAGINEIIINVNYFAEQIMAILEDGKRYGVQIQYSEEKNGLLGTGGGILKALPLLGDQPFISLSADIWTDFPFQTLFNKNDYAAHLVMVNNPPFHPKGDFGLTENQITHNDPKKTYGNIAVLHPDLFENRKPGYFSLAEVLNQPIHDGDVTGELYTGVWYNVGTPEILDRVRQQSMNL